MSSTKVKAGIKNLQYIRAHLKPEVRAQALEVVKLYESRKIDNVKTAEKILNQLNRKNTIETAVEKINTFKAIKKSIVTIFKTYYQKVLTRIKKYFKNFKFTLNSDVYCFYR